MCLISVLIRLYTYVYVGAHIHTTIVPSWRVIAGPCSTTSADVDAPHCSLFGARYRRWGPSRLKFLCDSMSRAPWLLKTCQGLPKTLRTVLYLDVLHLDQQDFWEKLEQSPQTQMTSHDRWVAFFFHCHCSFCKWSIPPGDCPTKTSHLHSRVSKTWIPRTGDSWRSCCRADQGQAMHEPCKSSSLQNISKCFTFFCGGIVFSLESHSARRCLYSRLQCKMLWQICERWYCSFLYLSALV